MSTSETSHVIKRSTTGNNSNLKAKLLLLKQKNSSQAMGDDILTNEISPTKKLSMRNSISCQQMLEQYSLPDNFEIKILELEDQLSNNKIKSDQLIELINLYSVKIKITLIKVMYFVL